MGGSVDYGIGSAAIVANSPPGDARNDGAVTILSSQGKYIIDDYSNAAGPKFAFLSRPTTKTAFADARFTATEQVALNHSTIKSDPAIRDWVTVILNGGTPNGIGAPGSLMLGGAASSTDLVFSPRSGQESDPPEASLLGGSVPSADPLQTEALATQLIDVIAGSTSAGGNATYSVPVDTTAKFVFTATLDGSVATFSLVDPGGNAILATGGNVTRQEIVDGETKMVRFDVVNPTVGVWQLKVDATGALEQVAYELRVSCESNFALAGSWGGRFRQGIAIPLSAALGDLAAGSISVVPGAVIEARLLSPNGVIVGSPLLDDGLQSDGDVGDGTFGCSVSPAPEAGWHSITYRAEGVHPVTGETFRRLIEGQICVGRNGGFISGEPAYETIDSDENGFADVVRVEIPVTVSESGNYVVSGKLVDVETGTEITASTAFVREAVGTANVTLLFSPRDLPEGQAYGPFDLQDVDLFLQLEAPEWADRFSGSLRVFATLYNEFSRSIRITGSLDFGTVPLAQQAVRNITLHNDGWESLNVTALSLPSGFAASFEGRIDPGESATVQVRFTPWAEGVYSGQLGVESDAAAGEPFADISGTGGPEEIPMSGWLEDKGVPADQRGPNDDPGGGRPNILAYLFNVHPVSGIGQQDGQALPQAGMVRDGEDDYLTLTYRRNRNATGLAVTVEGSDNLGVGSWQTVVPDAILDADIDPNTGDRIVEIRIKMGTATRKFARLRVVEQ